jgi:hypothetical protein
MPSKMAEIGEGVGRGRRCTAIGLWPCRADGPVGTIALPKLNGT